MSFQQSFLIDKTCYICFDKMTNPIKLPCKHLFCSECINEFIKSKLNNKDFSIQCPYDGCEKELDYLFLRDKLTSKDFEVLSEIIFKNNAIQGLKPNEMMISCLNPDCKMKTIIWKESDYTQVCPNPKCLQKFCLKCRNLYHPNMTCDEMNFSDDDRYLQQVKLDLGLVSCPHCKSLVEKSLGCNFIRCKSEICQNKKFFCLLCLEKLTEDEHFAHYSFRDPFNGECLVKDEQGEWVPNQIVQQQHKLNIKQNDFPCPGCKTVNPVQSKLILNFNSKVSLCTSEYCQNTYYCLTCFKAFPCEKINIQKLNSRIANHFDMENDFACNGRYCQIQ